MDLTSTKSVSSSDTTQTSSLSAKMKRLQIEESLLLQSIHKCVPEASQTDGGVDDAPSYLSYYVDFKAFLGKTKSSYKEIQLLFQDIKACTSSTEMLKTLDIDDVKKTTLELENRIKAFKSYLQTELTSLKSAEQQLHETVNEYPVLVSKLKRQPRVQTAKYNEIVPSPVKSMMTSPFKCLEVQQFQEFMTNSANRYGGWNEYHHNIFVNHWQKYFGSQIDTSFDAMNCPMKTSPAFNLFIYELLPKLLDIREEDIISHVKWYSKYIYLKDRQQKAIDNWRSNRQVMKSAKAELALKKHSSVRIKNNRRKTGNNYNIDISSTDASADLKDLVPESPTQDEVRFIRKCYSENVQGAIYLSEERSSNSSTVENLTPKNCEGSEDDGLLPFQKPTKQWCFRINSHQDNNTETKVNNLEDIKKLRVPAWRVGL